jgi:hypothetical protein
MFLCVFFTLKCYFKRVKTSVILDSGRSYPVPGCEIFLRTTVSQIVFIQNIK